MYFNTLNNMVSENISLPIKILCFFDFYRETFLYFRYFVMGLFLKKLITNTDITEILMLIPFMSIVIVPYLYFIFV